MEPKQHEFWIGVDEACEQSDTPSHVALLQGDLGILFPQSFVQIHEKGSKHLHGIVSDDGTVENFDFHALIERRSDSCRKDIRSARCRMLNQLEESRTWFEKVVPFAQNGAGTQYCFDYNKGGDPFITKFDWDYHVLARSFDELLLRSAGVVVVPISNDEVLHLLDGLPPKW